MKNLTLILATLSLSQILVGCQGEETTTTPDSEIQSFTQASLSTPQPDDYGVDEIEAPQLPPINSNTEALSFISTPSASFKLTAPVNQHSSSSDEYWTTVSGAQLNNGVNLAISQGSSVIRISPRADFSTGALQHSKAITPDKIQLFKIDNKSSVNKSSSYIHSMADPEALATAGLDDDSSALTMSASAKPGQYQLKVSQPLSVNSSYLVNVKENQSPYKLKVSSQARLPHSANSLELDLQLSGSNTSFTPQASLKHENGHYQPLKISAMNGRWIAQLPEASSMPATNSGLTEIQIDMKSKVNGFEVKRTVKTVFKQYAPSAKIQPLANTGWQEDVPTYITFDLAIEEPGRFAISGYLTGTDSAGNDQIILKSESADWLTPENTSIILKLDPQLILASGVGAPFKVKGLELKDQGQMARLSYQQEALILNK
ncbi:DUF4785 domain-containing protein [Shewanella sp. UCD-KL12]|uniref:DUF4785 domain-containing protein n=1 Tax=Shewanella sp. UCD-KL12 TaxID=1917163 RepID=UPI00097069B7|nr:DUF4785 domain-containing protein [Shewanella sp. UCD-KL12]